MLWKWLDRSLIFLMVSDPYVFIILYKKDKGMTE